MPGAPSLASPKGPPIGAPGQRREREKVRGRWRGEKVKLKASGIVKKHTLLCVFTCLLDELSFSLHGQKKKRHMFFYPPVLGHKTPSNTVLLTSFNTWDLGWLGGIQVFFLSLLTCLLRFRASIPRITYLFIWNVNDTNVAFSVVHMFNVLMGF